jgi:hypothetical protein
MIIFVTMFKNIGRDSWKSYSRSEQDYLDYFKHLAENIEYPLVVYVENHILKKIVALESVKLRSNIILIDSSTIKTYLDTHLESEKQIMNSEAYKQKIPEYRKKNPEHIIPEYTLINHSKVQFLSYTKKIIPGYNHYAWIDFGWVRNGKLETLPKNIDLSKLGKKILINNLDPLPKQNISPEVLLSSFDIFFAIGSFIVPNHLVERLQVAYDKKLEEWKTKGIADDDQNLFYQLWIDNKDMFEYISTGHDNWFALYRDYLNQKT